MAPLLIATRARLCFADRAFDLILRLDLLSRLSHLSKLRDAILGWGYLAHTFCLRVDRDLTTTSIPSAAQPD
jgi:hypothetical protein